MKKAFSLVMVISALASSAAVFAADACPTGIEGGWFCHEVGMPGDGTDETTYSMSIQANRTGDEIVSYSLGDETRKLDGSWNLVPSLSRGPNSGSTLDWYRQDSCADGKLVATYKGYDANGKLDSQGRPEIFEMQDADHFTRTQPLGYGTDICTRQ